MKRDQNSRRSFLKNLTIGGIGVSAVPGLFGSKPAAFPAEKTNSKTGLHKEQGSRAYNAPYHDDYLNRIAFPIGGIGAGMFCLEGTGAISHMSVRHNPEIFFEPSMFAALSIKGIENGARILEGKVPNWKKFGQREAGLGGVGGNTWGLPRFDQAVFTAAFPFATIDLHDARLPVDVTITGWNPFIPTDEDNASLPVGGLEYQFTNVGDKAATCVFSYNARNFMVQPEARNSIGPIKNGFILSSDGTEQAPEKEGHFAVYTGNEQTVVDHCWFRGAWFDPLTMLWNTIKEAGTKNTSPVESDAPGASLFVPFELAPGEKKVIRLHMAWYVPNSKLQMGEMIPEVKEASEKDPLLRYYKPWYSQRFAGIGEIAAYWAQQYDLLRKNSTLFKDAFYNSTLPAEVTEAIAANLTILKSPTVMRQYDGRFWNWEGCGDNWGSCHGSCTHVWNYAQAVPHLFPNLERSLRHTEFNENQNAEGHQGFRANLPISPLVHNFHSAADGQLGGIMKVYREWRISGDHDWLKELFPNVKASMDYCIRTWDPDRKGMLQEPQHNTYDIEFWGPNGMLTGFYLGALSAFIHMGTYLNEPVDAYNDLYKKGKAYMEETLFDGEYFTQKIAWKGLHAPDPTKAQSFSTKYSEEALDILQKEGPKYQYGSGCLSDGVLGTWIARVCGLDNPVDAEKIKSHLLAVHRYNLKKDLINHANPQRSTFAIGDDAGLLLCSWPKGGMLSLPFVYSNEVWTGIEYQAAAHLMLMGEVEKGLEIVRACRNRYDGRVRNPFNEYECGHWYARAMSSYGMLQGLTGVRYDAVDKTLYVDSKVGDFTSFIAAAGGFGNVRYQGGNVSLDVMYGKIDVKTVVVGDKETTLTT